MSLANDITRLRESERHARLMDRIYGSQRSFYDFSRKYYLLGRDELIQDLAPPSGGRILEIGCGTARNLICAAQKWPDAEYVGVDISTAMLKTARKNVKRSRLNGKITLFQGDAEDLSRSPAWDGEGFDRVFLSFCISMIPDWQTAIRQALAILKPSGELHAVDFGQLENLPPPARFLLGQWLALFHVQPRKYLRDFCRELDSETGTRTEFRNLYRGYSWQICVRPSLGSDGNHITHH